MATIHALHRATGRVGAVLDAESIDLIVNTADAFAAKCGPFESVALRLRTLTMVGQAWSDTSNGDTLVAIIRGREVQTFMFRRRTQPFRPDALNVDRVVIL
jgi:hypothetical protein